MEFTPYFILLGLSALFIVVSTWVNGQIGTETATLGGADVFLTRTALYGNSVAALMWVALLVSPILIGWNWIEAALVMVLMLGFGWLMVAIPVVTLLLGIIAHLRLRRYSRKTFGTDRPDYDNWQEYQDESRKTHSDTVIVFGGNHWHPFRQSTQASLEDRATDRSHRTSSSSSGSASRTSTFGASHRSSSPVVLPVFFGSSSRSSGSSSLGSSHRTSGSSSKSSSSSSSGGDGLGKAIAGLFAALAAALKAIIAVLLQVLVVIALAAVVVLFAFLAYKFNKWLFDVADETYVLDVYAS